MTHRTSIIVPCHNEERHIIPLLRRIEISFASMPHEVIVVIDGCSDASENIVRAFAAHHKTIHILTNPKRLGKGGAIRAGIKQATGNVIGFIDGDNEIDPRHLRHAFDVLQDKHLDLVIGNRYASRGGYHTTFMRHLTSRIYQCMLFLLFGLGIEDAQAGVKVFSADVAKKLFNASSVNGYAFDIDILMHAHWAGYRMAAVPLKQHFKGTSTVTLPHVFLMLADTCGTYDRHVKKSLSEAKKMNIAPAIIHCIRSTIFYPCTWVIEKVARVIAGV